MKLSSIALFNGLAEAEILEYIKNHNGIYKEIGQGDYVFRQNDDIDSIYILIEGEIVLCKDFYTGHRHNVAVFNEYGEMFAEVYAFLQSKPIDYSAFASVDSRVLKLSNSIFTDEITKTKEDIIVLNNFISIMANKAYFLNKKLQILAIKTLRGKIAHIILANINNKGYWVCNLTRDALADYLNVARPSLSRELMNMQEEGLIRIEKNKIFVDDIEALNEYL